MKPAGREVSDLEKNSDLVLTYLLSFFTSFTHVLTLHDSHLNSWGEIRTAGEISAAFYYPRNSLARPSAKGLAKSNLPVLPRARHSPGSWHRHLHIVVATVVVRRGQARRLSRLRLRPSRAAQKRAAQGKLGG